MKIDTFEIDMSSSRKFLESNQVKTEVKTTFQELFDNKTEFIKQSGEPDKKELESSLALSGSKTRFSSQWYEVSTIGGNAAVRLSDQFLDELKKLYEILDRVMENLSSLGNMNNQGCCCHLEKINRVNINPVPVAAPRTFCYEILKEETFTHFEEEKTNFEATGLVKTLGGQNIDFSLQLDLQRSFFHEDTYTYQENGKFTLIDPLIINYPGNSPQLSDVNFTFDLDNDGKSEEIASLLPGSGLLSFDKNNDGIINNGGELFGPSTGDGFLELAEYDLDNNLWIDENDDIFNELTIWENDEDGEMQLTRIKDAGIGAIYLANAATPFDLKNEDNVLKGKVKKSGIILNEDGSVGSIQELDWTV